MKRFWLALIALGLATVACAQTSVRQSGNITPGHATKWVTNGVVGDAGTAAAGGLTSIGVTGTGFGICQNTAATSGPYTQTCLGADTNGNGTISVQRYNGAPTSNFRFLQDGVALSFGVTTNGNNILTGDNYFTSGRPYCDVRGEGALGDGVTNDTPAILRCVARLQSTYGTGIVYFPPSTSSYCAPDGIVNSAGVIVYRGATAAVTVSACGADVSVFKMNWGSSSIESLTVLGKGIPGQATPDTTFGASHPAIWMTANCIGCFIDDVYVQGGSNAILMEGQDSKIYRTSAAKGYGSATVAIRAGGWLIRNAFDDFWPVALPAYGSTFNNWAATTAYNVGDVVLTDNFYIQCSVAGTSAGTKPTLQNFGTPITDGATLRWQLATPVFRFGLLFDTGAKEVMVNSLDVGGPHYASIGFRNSLAGTLPNQITLNTIVVGASIFAGLFAESGSDLAIIEMRGGGGIITGSVAIQLVNTWGGYTSITDSTILGGGTGILMQAGVINTVIANNRRISTANGVAIQGTDVTGLVVSNNIIPAGNFSAINITGTSNRCNVIGNIVYGLGITNCGGADVTTSGNN